MKKRDVNFAIMTVEASLMIVSTIVFIYGMANIMMDNISADMLVLTLISAVFAYASYLSLRDTLDKIGSDSPENESKDKDDDYYDFYKEEDCREYIEELIDGEWKSLEPNLLTLYKQTEKMDSLQEKLIMLLDDDSARIFSDVKDTMDVVEKNILANIRKVFNFTTVCDAGCKEDVKKVKEEINKAVEKNNECLAKVKNLLFTLTEYLNNQEEEGDLSIIGEYEDTIREQIKKEG